MARMQLTSEGIGSLFTIRDADWKAIGKRVALVELSRPAAPQIARLIPPFPALVEECERWRFDTFPSLVRGAHMVAAWADWAVSDFVRLQDDIREFSSRPVLVEVMLAHARRLLVHLAEETTQLQQRFNPILARVRTFARCNADVDAVVARNTRNLGPEWRPLTDEATRLEHATAVMLGELQAVTDDLAGAARSTTIDTQFLLDLEIEAALRAWRNIQTQAAAFAASAREAA